MPMTRDEIISVLGPVDEVVIADLLATGATVGELREAWGWLHSEEAMVGSGHPMPDFRVRELMEILEPDEDEA